MDKTFDRVPRDVVWWVLRKLDVEEWLIRVVQPMYRNTRSQVRINSDFSDDFLLKVGLHQRSVLSPLLFIIVLEALSSEIRSGCPEELLNAVDIALVSETLADLFKKLESWKSVMESKGLRVYLGKTKVTINSSDVGKNRYKRKYPCGVYRKGVNNNSIYCKFCKLQVHKLQAKSVRVVGFLCQLEHRVSQSLMSLSSIP